MNRLNGSDHRQPISHGDPCDSMQQENASDSNGSETEDGEGSAHRSITRGRH